MKKRNIWARLGQVVRNNLPLTVIIAAALLLGLAMGVMYYSAQNIIQRTVQRLMNSEMNAICLSIRNRLDKVEMSVDTMSWNVNGRQKLDDVINEGKEYKSTQRYLITRSGFLLSGKDDAAFQAVLKLVNADVDRTGNQTMVDEHGQKKHVFYHPVGGMTDWVLICVCNDNEIFGKLRMVQQTLLLLVFAGLALLTFIVLRTRRNLERLRRVNAEKERIGSELRVASRIQQDMLPHEEVIDERLEVRGSLVPAREVGGDLFDYHIRDGKLFFCIGDVSGKGAASALMMSVVQTKFRDFSAHEDNPARIMQNINVGCCQNNQTNMFVTLFIGVLDLSTGHLNYCNAGHDAPFILSKACVTAIAVIPNLPVGVFDNFTYSMQETQIVSQSTLFLYTDGLTEAMDEHHKQFGMERVETLLNTCLNLEPMALIERVTDDVHGFVKGAEQSDDLTMLAIRYL